MKHYSIKPLEWVERKSWLRAFAPGCEFVIHNNLKYNKPVVLTLAGVDVTFGKSFYTNQDYFSEHPTIEAAKAHAQQLWEDSLKQYLEDVK